MNDARNSGCAAPSVSSQTYSAKQSALAQPVDKNPLVRMVQVNGFIVDVRHMPREVQEIAYEKGLIPYIPADRG
jgi:hypothetical protein